MVGSVAEEDDMNPVGACESPVFIIVDIEHFDDGIVVADFWAMFEWCNIVAIDHNTFDDQTMHVVLERQDLSSQIHMLEIGPSVPITRTEPEVDQTTIVPERGRMHVVSFEGRMVPRCVVQG